MVAIGRRTFWYQFRFDSFASTRRWCRDAEDEDADFAYPLLLLLPPPLALQCPAPADVADIKGQLTPIFYFLCSTIGYQYITRAPV